MKIELEHSAGLPYSIRTTDVSPNKSNHINQYILSQPMINTRQTGVSSSAPRPIYNPILHQPRQHALNNMSLLLVIMTSPERRIRSRRPNRSRSNSRGSVSLMS